MKRKYMPFIVLLTCTLISYLNGATIFDEERVAEEEYVPAIPVTSSSPKVETHLKSEQYNPTVPSTSPTETTKSNQTNPSYTPIVPVTKPTELPKKENSDTYEPVVSNQEIMHEALSGCNTYDIPIISSGIPIIIYDKYSFSPATLNQDWYSCDHIGYTDKAYSGARHIACISPGLLMMGYAQPPYSDFILRKFESGDKIINVVQAPYRADWHTFKGNGVLFNATISGSFSKFDNTPEDTLPSLSGYFICAEQSKIILYHFSNVSLNSLVENSETLDSCEKLLEIDKPCPAQNFTIIYRGGVGKIYLGTKLIYTGSLSDGDYAGLLSCYGEHNCESLSSIYYNNFSYNGVDYLKGGQKK